MASTLDEKQHTHTSSLTVWRRWTTDKCSRGDWLWWGYKYSGGEWVVITNKGPCPVLLGTPGHISRYLTKILSSGYSPPIYGQINNLRPIKFWRFLFSLCGLSSWWPGMQSSLHSPLLVLARKVHNWWTVNRTLDRMSEHGDRFRLRSLYYLYKTHITEAPASSECELITCVDVLFSSVDVGAQFDMISRRMSCWGLQ